MSDEKSIWKDVVAVAKFAVSCLGIVASSCVFIYNIEDAFDFDLGKKFFGEHADDNKYKGKK